MEGGSKKKRIESNNSDEEVDYMSADFVTASTSSTIKMKGLKNIEQEEDDEDRISASLFSTTYEERQVEPYSRLDYEEDEYGRDKLVMRGNQEDEEEDYMSESFLARVEDVRPGIRTTASYQRMLKCSSNKEAAEQGTSTLAKKMKKGELEKHRLNEGLSQPVSEQSKGFALLSKMGFKPGMSLGKRRTDGEDKGDTRLKEPIAIQTQFMTSRTGLGHEEEQKTKQRERCELHLKAMAQRAQMEDALADDFRTRKRGRANLRQLVGDIRKCRKVCEELGTRKGAATPFCEWFWPSYVESDPHGEHYFDEDERAARGQKHGSTLATAALEEVQKFVYSSGKAAPPNPDFMGMAEDELQQRLGQINVHLRAVHFYCVWCGCGYESSQELESSCPGETREDHGE